MNYLRKAFNLYQMTHRVDASTTDIQELEDEDPDSESATKNTTDSTRSAAKVGSELFSGHLTHLL